jgi:hypothetical protein
MTTHAHARENLGVVGRLAAICLTAIMLAAASMSGAFAAQDAAEWPMGAMTKPEFLRHRRGPRTARV